MTDSAGAAPEGQVGGFRILWWRHRGGSVYPFGERTGAGVLSVNTWRKTTESHREGGPGGPMLPLLSAAFAGLRTSSATWHSRGREFDPPLQSYHSAWFSTRSTQRRLNGGRVSSARKLEHPRVSVGCPYTDPIHGHRVRQRPPGSPRFLTHAMGCDGVGNALNVNRTLEVGGSTPLGSTRHSSNLAGAGHRAGL